MSMKGSGIALSICLLIIITSVSYYPSTTNGFTNWDDQNYVLHNSLIRDFSWGTLHDIFEFTDIKNNKEHFTVKYIYVPLTILSFAVEYHLFKLAPGPYHITNLLFHLANCLLVFFLMLKLSKNLIPSFFTALLFGIHPLHVESVAWISERKDVLYGFFYLFSLYFYVEYIHKCTSLNYCAALFLFLLSLLSKPMAITLPVLLFVVDYFLERKLDRMVIMEKIPFFALSLVFSFIASTIVHIHKITENAASVFNPLDMVFTPCGRIVFYLMKMVAPFNLSSYYPRSDNFIANLHSPVFLLSPVVILFFTAAIIISMRCTRKIAFGTSFFLITILPAVIAMPGYGGIKADRYTYIPLIGLFFIISEGLYSLYRKDWKHSSVTRPLLFFMSTFLMCSLSIMTFCRCTTWKDSISLWSDVIRQSPRISLAYNNRGDAYLEIREADRAIEDFNHAIEYGVNNEEYYYNRAAAYIMKGDFDNALNDLNRVIEIKPDSTAAYNIRGALFFNMKNFSKALADYDRALMKDPGCAKACYNKGTVYNAIGDPDKAMENFNQALEIDNGYGAAYMARGNLRGISKDFNGALDDFNHVLALEPVNRNAYISRAITFFSLGNYRKAMDDVISMKKLGQDVDPNFIRDIEKYLDNGSSP